MESIGRSLLTGFTCRHYHCNVRTFLCLEVFEAGAVSIRVVNNLVAHKLYRTTAKSEITTINDINEKYKIY